MNPPDPEPDRGEVTRLLAELGRGDEAVAERLLPLIYDDLRGLARRQLGHEREGHTLDPTALVHEAWLRLRPGHAAGAESRGRYFALAARIMRSLLVDHARRRRAGKRAAAGERVTLSAIGDAAHEVEILDLHEALERLSAVDEQLGRIAELRIFGGMTQDEVAATLAIPKRTLERRWRVASTWLRRELES